MVAQIERHLARIVAGEAGEAILDVGRIADFGGLAIAHNAAVAPAPPAARLIA